MQSLAIKPQNDSQVISSIRIFAICSILWGHCHFGLETASLQNDSDIILQSFAIQLGKIGTILFFLIAGILVQPKIKHYTVTGFLKHRFSPTILPWIIFVLLLVPIVFMNDMQAKLTIINGLLRDKLIVVYQIMKYAIFYHAYWFTLVFIISMIVLIIFKAYIFNLKMGIPLCLITVFYGINLHYVWISVHHTKAFLGYVFFIWLGIQISAHYAAFKMWVAKIQWTVLLPVLVLTFILACAEGQRLSKMGCSDPYASIRISNAALSLMIYLCFLKAGAAKSINAFIPDKAVYGIYLLHTLLLYQETMLIRAFSTVLSVAHKISFLFVMHALDFIFVLLISNALVKGFYKIRSLSAIPDSGIIFHYLESLKRLTPLKH